MNRQTSGGIALLLALSVTVILLGGQTSSSNSSSERWEYAVYEVETTYANGTVFSTSFRWITNDAEVAAGGEKFRLFKKLGAQEVMANKHDLVLWNHLAGQGWEYIEQFDKTLGTNATQSQTVFRRRLAR